MQKKNYTNAKIAFIHGRPGPHKTHAAFADSVNADFIYVDRLLRYHDLENAGKVRRYASWLVNSVFFENVKKYDLILSEGMHLPPVLMKKLRVLRRDQKIAGMMGDEFLFFLNTKWYSPKTQKLLTYVLCQYDSLICLSDFQTELANEILDGQKKMPKIISGHEIISGERPMPSPDKLPKLNGHQLLFIAHGPSGWRGYYKGIETLLETFKIIVQKFQDAELTVIGNWDTDYIDELLVKTGNTRENIHFVGLQNDLMSFFEQSDLYVHITNGDAFPIASLEAIRAGLPTIVSDLTGTKEVVNKIEEKFVVPMNAAAAAAAIESYFNLPVGQKKKISEKGREVMETQYSKELGIEEFRSAIDEILQL